MNTLTKNTQPLRPGGENLTLELIRTAGIHKGKILDIGCGMGQSANLLCQLGFEVIGIDISKASVEYADSMYPGIEFICQDIGERGFEPESFDCVLCECVLSILPNLPEILQYIFTIIKDGGYLLWSDICSKSQQSLEPRSMKEWEHILSHSGFTSLHTISAHEQWMTFVAQLLWEGFDLKESDYKNCDYKNSSYCIGVASVTRN